MSERAGNASGRRNGRAAAELPSLTAVVEAILFASDRPVSLVQLREAVPEADPEAVAAALQELRDRYADPNVGVDLQELADGFQVTTKSEHSVYVERFLVGRRRARLSRAALETLSTISYRQPITRGEIEELRGVDCGQVLHTLVSRDLITVKGRSEGLGRPLLYATTPEFLTYFGLRTLSDLPNLEEFQALGDPDPLEDPEIREALEASGLLEDLLPPGDGTDALGPEGLSESSEVDLETLAGSATNDLGSPDDATTEEGSAEEQNESGPHAATLELARPFETDEAGSDEEWLDGWHSDLSPPRAASDS